jgi:hypothetical protein
MLLLSGVTAGYCFYFIVVLIPRYGQVTFFFKILTVLILYISLATIHKHLTSLNSVIISQEGITLGFLLRSKLIIPWHNLRKMEIYKVITHYWKLSYIDANGLLKIYKTSLAFPGIMEILLLIQAHKPDIELNELLRQVLLYKTQQTNKLDN